jgi:hypothetical protein
VLAASKGKGLLYEVLLLRYEIGGGGSTSVIESRKDSIQDEPVRKLNIDAHGFRWCKHSSRWKDTPDSSWCFAGSKLQLIKAFKITPHIDWK